MPTPFKNLKEALTLSSLVIYFLNTFRHIILQSARKGSFVEIVLQFKRLFQDQSYFSVIVIHVQLCKYSWYKQPQKKKIGSINPLKREYTYFNLVRKRNIH